MLETITPHPQYTEMLNEITEVRDCVLGEHFVKKRGYTYLPHPSQIDKVSKEQIARYDLYKKGAEFDEIPAQTLKSLVGKIKADDTDIEIPAKIEYLMDDVDKDGLSMVGLINWLSEEIPQTEYALLVADYEGLSDLELKEISIEELERSNPRGTIKQYTRENIWDWHFDRINGRMQLRYLMLREVGYSFDPVSHQRTVVDSFLKLALDENGNYYQQKIVQNADNKGFMESEPNYPTIRGQALSWIPAEIVASNEMTSGKLPIKAGWLSSICKAALSRYRVSADYKEAMRNLPPTTHVFGVGKTQWDQFKEINGHGYVATGAGAVNVWPPSTGADVDVKIIGAEMSTEGYERYFEISEKKIRALGGSFPSDELRQRTATEVATESQAQTDKLTPMVNSIEQAISRMCAYVAMFEGLAPVENIEVWMKDNISIVMPREFAAQKLSTEEVKQHRENWMAGALTKEEYVKILEMGGWTISKADDLLSDLESEPPRLTAMPGESNITKTGQSSGLTETN